jgi:hypothetical protein
MGSNSDQDPDLRVPCIMNEFGSHGPEYVPIKEIWESFNGWVWYITETDKEDPDYCFGYVVGLESEWGYIDKQELKALGPYRAWKIPRQNWQFNSRVKMIPRKELQKEARSNNG